MKNSFNFFRIGVLIVFVFSVCMSMTSCIGAKKLRYFQDLPDSTHIFLPPISLEERVIEYGDNLNIMITAEETEAIAFFNAQGGLQGGGNSPESGYLVNPLGIIEFPILGKVKCLGLTARQLKELLTELIAKYVKNPLVEVRFNTFKITILGEVRGAGTHTLSMQRTTIFEALAAAGDLPQTAKRSDIFLYRDYDGERTITKIDLRKKDILYNAELFQMRHNDVIYVQPFRRAYFRENFGFFTSIVSVLIGILTIILTINYYN